jgi:hypothetical protein
VSAKKKTRTELGDCLEDLIKVATSAVELAAKTGIDRNLIYAWKNQSNKKPTVDGALRLADYESKTCIRPLHETALKWLRVSGRNTEADEFKTVEDVQIRLGRISSRSMSVTAESTEEALLKKYARRLTDLGRCDPEDQFPWELADLRQFLAVDCARKNLISFQEDWLKKSVGGIRALVLQDYPGIHEDFPFFVGETARYFIIGNDTMTKKAQLWPRLTLFLPSLGDLTQKHDEIKKKYRESLTKAFARDSVALDFDPSAGLAKCRVFFRTNASVKAKINFIAYGSSPRPGHANESLQGALLVGNDELAWRLINFLDIMNSNIEADLVPNTAKNRQLARELTTCPAIVDTSLIKLLLKELEITPVTPNGSITCFEFTHSKDEWVELDMLSET